MAAVVSGGSLGLVHSSLALLGAQGQLGTASHGRASERVYVNAATGNLVIQGQDEVLVGRGPDALTLRTYNSRGLLDDDNADNWRAGLYRRVHSLTGTANTAGSTVKRTDADGAEATYTWNATLAKYVSSEGSGAYDTLAFAANVWTWTDGDTGVRESYDALNGGRLTQVLDLSNNAMSFAYAGALLASVTTASGETTHLDYTGNNLTRVRTVKSGGGEVIRTSYTYDGSNRLWKVTTDLTPESTGDTATYVTTYTYDGASKRVASMTQTDGTSVAFTYVEVTPGDWRVATITDAGRVTTYGYNTVARTTTVTDPMGQATVLAYDAAGRLTGVTMPAVGGVSQQLAYAYDASGNVTSVTDAKGNVVTYQYDASGNRIREQDAVGNVVERVFGTKNELLAETSYTAAATTIASSTGETWTVYDKARIEGQPAYLDLPGLGGSYASTPDSAAASITGDIDLRLKVALNDWTPAATSTLISKEVEPNRSYYLRVNTNGTLSLLWSPNGLGTGLITRTSTVAVGGVDGAVKWIRATLDADNGTAGHDVRFHTSNDGVTWTQLGATVTTAGTASIFDGTAPVMVGARSGGAYEPLAGKVYYAEVRNGIDGAVAVKFDPTAGLARQTAAPLTSRYVYDASNRLRFTVSAEGRVTEYVYNGYGQQEAKVEYTASRYNVAPLAPSATLTEATLTAWLPADRSTTVRTDTTYDFRGLVQTVTTYKTVSAAGLGLQDGTHARTYYEYDQAGKLLKTVDARGSGIADTSYRTTYAYDGLGRLTSTTDALGRSTSTVYDDANGKTVLTLANGLVTTSTYDSAGRLTGVLQSANSTNLGETRYFYDANGNLRRTEDPTGVKSHLLYDEAGRKVASIDGDGSLTEYLYDANDRATKTIRYANAVSAANLASLIGAGGQPTAVVLAAIRPSASGTDEATWNAYDAAGRLVKTVDAGGFVTQYFYDGADRLTDTIHYAAAISTAALTANPAPGDIAPPQNVNADRVARNFYDADGKLRASLDGEGYVAEHRYDAAGQLAETVRYATATSATLRPYGTLAQLLPAPGAADIHTYHFYNARGQLARTIDGEGYATDYTYDKAGNRTQATRYATRLAGKTLNLPGGTAYAITPDSPALSITGDIDLRVHAALEDWTPAANNVLIGKEVEPNRSFFLRVNPNGTLALLWSPTGLGANYLTRTSTVAVGAADSTAKWVRATLDVNNGSGGHEVKFYTSSDGATWTQLGATVTATGSTSIFDGTAGVTVGARWSGGTEPMSGKIHYAEIRNGIGGAVAARFDPSGDAGAGAVTSFASSSGETWTVGGAASLAPFGQVSASPQDEVTAYTYDALNRVASETNPEGTVTEYTYDEVGRLTRTVRAASTAEARTLTVQYDRQGRLTAELSANGAALLTGSQTQAEIDAIWAQHAVKHTYDAAGRRTSTTDPLGNKSVFYYDADGRLTHTVNALGEVKESNYNALGQLTQSIRYGTRIATAGLGGGLNTAISPITNAALDSVVSYVYYTSGRLQQSTDPLGNAFTQAWNAFGELASSTQAIGGGQTLVHQYTYDRRGLLKVTAWDPSGINATQSTQYDAFGRATQVIDANGNVRTTTYDRLGRVVTVTDPAGNRTTTYDAFSRVLTQSDRLGNVTTYSYDTGARKVTVTTPEGVSLETVRNRHGETATLKDGSGGVTTYTYDRSGNTVSVIDAAGGVSTKAYDAADNLVESTDANGTRTVYSYDAAKRLFTRRVDPSGLNLATVYAYDAKGQAVSVTDPSGVVTQTSFDRKGQATSVVVDPGGLNLKTTFTYDARGKKLTVTEGADTAVARTTQYAYDKLGRLLNERLDPSGLNLTTAYTYDKNGNVVTKTNAGGHVARYFYDASDRLVLTLDPLNAATKSVYDAEGRTTETIAYANPVGGLPGSPTLAQVQAAIVTDAARDAITRSVYDRDGREIYSIDALWGVTKKTYDGNGNVVQRIAYASPIPSSTPLAIAAVTTALQAVAGTADRESRTFYDAVNRPVYVVDALGFVKQTQYDPGGRIVGTLHYAQAVTPDATPTAAEVAAALAAQPAGLPNQVNAFVYDTAGRLAASTDAEGFTESFTYDAAGNKTSFTNKKGATWTYQYDAQGRLVRELSPAVAVTSVSEALVATTSTLPIETRIAYDALGNVVSRTEAYGLPEARITTYEYDAAGRQVRTNYPPVSVYNAPADDLTTNGTNGTVARVETTRTLYSRVTYDALGQGTVNQDIGGGYSYKVYDALGRVKYEIDAERYVTEYGYDRFGNKLTVTRYATALNFAAITGYAAHAEGTAFTAAEVAARLAPSAGDRTITTQYDRLNRATLVTEPAAYTYDSSAPAGAPQYFTVGRTTRNTYNAFGQVVRGATLKNPGTDLVAGSADDVWLDTYLYYDRRGSRTAQVDALGYLTRWEYDETGDVTRQVEYAQALAAGTWSLSGHGSASARTPQSSPGSTIGYDREVTYQYDRKNQKIAETRVNAEYGTVTGTVTLGTATASLVTSFAYDGVGNLTAVTDASGATTYTYYDALGRVVATAEPARFSEGGSGAVVMPAVHVGYEVSTNGRTVSFAKNAPTDSTVAFAYRVLGSTGGWTTASLQAQGGNYTFTPPAASERYEYQLTYTKSGEATPYATGTGTFSVIGPSSTASANVVTAVRESTFTIHGIDASAHYDVQPGWEGGYYVQWSGSNQVRLSWGSLDALGSGNIRVRLHYRNYSYVGQGTEWAVYGSQSTGINTYRDHVFSASAASTGATLSWSENESYGSTFYAGIAAINAVEVWKVVDGQEIRIVNSSASFNQKDQLVIRGKTAGLTGIAAAGGGTLPVTALGAGVYTASLAGLSRKGYAYTPVGTTSLAGGSFEVTHSNTAGSAGIQEYDASSSGRTLRAYNLPASAHSAVLQFRPAGNTGPYLTKALSVLSAGAGELKASYDDISNGNYDFILTVRDSANNLVNLTGVGGTASGTLAGTMKIRRDGDLPSVTADPNALTLTPLTTVGYNAFGNVVQTTRHAKGAVSAEATNYGVPGMHADDQVSLNFYDAHGHVTRAVDAEGSSVYSSYDDAGRVAKTWQPITDNDGQVNNAVRMFQYDKLGRQTASIEPSYLPTQALAVNTAQAAVQQQTLNFSASASSWHYGSEYQQAGWTTGSNAINVSWNEMGSWGAGNVLVTVDYTTRLAQNNGEYGWSFAAGYARSRTVELGAGATSTSFTWSDPALSYQEYGGTIGLEGSIYSVNRVRVWKKDVAGAWVLIHDRSASGAYSNRVNIAVPQQPGTAVAFKYKLQTAPTWTTGTLINIGTKYVSTTGFSGAYHFEFQYTRPGEANPSSASRGTFSISGATGSLTNGGSVTAWTTPPLSQANFARAQAQYNAFGEITAKGLNDGWQEYYHYDAAGRLWRTNDRDGVDKVALYDISGNATSQVLSQTLDLRNGYTSAAQVAALTSGVQRTDTKYDALGRITQQVQQSFTVDRGLDIIAAPITQPQLSLGISSSSTSWHYGSEYQQAGWTTGSNAINVSWNEMGSWGAGNVLVTVDYTTRLAQNNGEYGWSFAAGYARSRTVELGAGATSTSFTWSDPALSYQEYGGTIGLEGSIYSVNRVRVWKQVGSSWIPIHDRSSSGAYGRAVVWDKPTLVGTQIQFKYKLGSAPTWSTATYVDMGAREFINLAGLSGTYDYELLYTRPGETLPYAHATGQFTVSGASGSITQTTQTGNIVETISPVLSQTVDRWGNALSLTDARGHVTDYRYNYLDQMVEEKKPQADVWGTGGTSSAARPVLRNYFDRMGRGLGTVDANGNAATARYDAAGQLVAEYHADGGVVSYQYDALGRRIRAIDALGNASDSFYDRNDRLVRDKRPIGEENYVYDAAGNRIRVTNGEGQTTKYWYDTRGKLIRTKQPGGQETNVYYDLRGNKAREVTGNNDQPVWSYDYFGRALTHTDMGGGLYAYGYDRAGHLAQQTLTRPSVGSTTTTYQYYQNGALKRISDSLLANETFYEYDAAGNVTRERYTKSNTIYLDNRVSFDALNRVTRVEDNRYTISYRYDANGNRRNTNTLYYDSNNVQRTIDSWYLYDEMNRITLSQGVLSGGTIQINGSQGIQLQYDAASNRRVATSYQGGSLVTESYNYDLNNRLTTTYRGGNLSSSRSYDLAGRVTQDISYTSGGAINERRQNSYNTNGKLTSQLLYNSSGGLKQSTTFTGYDGMGNPTSYQMSVHTGYAYTNYYSYSYAKFDSYLERIVYGSSSYFSPGQTTSTYDIHGNIVSVSDQFAANRNRSFITDSAGRILRKTENGATQYYFYVDGKPIGSSGALSAADFDYNYTPVSQQYPAPTPGTHIVSQGDTLRSIALAVFGDAQLWFVIADANGLRSDSDLKPGQQITVPNKISNLHNDHKTFKVYSPGEIIGDTTPTLPDPPPPPAPKGKGGCGGLGSIIIIAVVIVATIFTAGAAAVAMGAVMAPGAGFMAAGMSVLAGGAGLGLSAGAVFGAAAIGGAVGSIVGQGIGIATGMQEKFSWSQVATSALGAGATAGLGAVTQGAGVGGMLFEKGSLAATMVNGAVGNAMSQGISIVTGQQQKFSWRDVAVGAISAPIMKSISETLNETTVDGVRVSDYASPHDIDSIHNPTVGSWASDRFGAFGARFLTDMANGVAASAVRIAAYGGGKMDFAGIAADAFGNALGNSIAEELARPRPQTVQPIVVEPESSSAANSAFRKVTRDGVTYYSDIPGTAEHSGDIVNVAWPGEGHFPTNHEEKLIALSNAAGLLRYGEDLRLLADQALTDRAVLDAYMSGDADLHRAARTTQGELVGFDSVEQMADFLASRLRQTADNVDATLARIGQLMRHGSLFDARATDPGAYLLARGLGAGDISRLGQTTIAGDALTILAPVLGPLAREAALQQDRSIADTLLGIGVLDKDTYGALSSRIVSAQDANRVALAIGAGLAAVAPVAAGAVGLSRFITEVRLTREIGGAADRAAQRLADDIASGIQFRGRGAEGTRAHQYFEDEIRTINSRLEARGSSHRINAEEFRYDVLPGQVRGDLAPYARAPGSRGVDAVLYRNGQPIRGFDLKTGGGWSPGELQALQKRFGIPIEQLFRRR